jgi:hypothetical protein
MGTRICQCLGRILRDIFLVHPKISLPLGIWELPPEIVTLRSRPPSIVPFSIFLKDVYRRTQVLVCFLPQALGVDNILDLKIWHHLQ